MDAKTKNMKEDASEKASPAAGEEVLAPVALNAQEIASLKDRAAKADENSGSLPASGGRF